MPEPHADSASATRAALSRPSDLEHLLNSIPGGVFIYEESPAGEGRLVYGNAGFMILCPPCAQTDAPPGLHPITHLFHPDESARVASDLERSAADLTPWHAEYRRETADGSTAWVEIRAEPRPQSHGVVRWTGFVSDVTARVTAEIQLRHARAEALRASRLKSDFIAAVSHELRTPMTAIIGYAELLQDDPRVRADSGTASAAEAILRNGEHLLSVVSDILDDSRVEAGAFSVRAAEIDLAQVAHDASDLLAIRARSRGIGLQFTADPRSPSFARADPLRVRQIILNLVGNAIKFTDRGSVRVSVSNAGGAASVTVADDGTGMDAEQLETLFRPYTQFNSARACEGSGLGMALSRRLARMMGGDLRVASTPGHGTTFTLSLPAIAPSLGDAPPVVEIAHDGASDAAASGAPGADREGDLAPPLAGFRILVAEDGPDNVRLYLRQLGRAGADVRVASNGREAVALAQAAAVGVLDAPFDLVLMDVQMPVLDGLEATRRLRALGFTVPVVAVTAAAGEEERARCLAAGCDGFLEKPVRQADLIAAARAAALRGRASAGPEHAPGAGSGLGHPPEAAVRDPHPMP